MSDDLKHITVTSYQVTEDGTQIDTKAYHDKLAHHKIEKEKRQVTSRSTFLKDLMVAATVPKEYRTREVVITIRTDENYDPKLITHRFTTQSKNFPR